MGGTTPEKVMCGTSCYVLFLTWLFLLFTPSMNRIDGAWESFETCLLRVVFLVAAMASQALMRPFADRLVSRRNMAVLSCLGMMLAPLAAFGNILPPPLGIL